jgi:hypothetical protein
MAQMPLDARLDSPRRRDTVSRNFQPNLTSSAMLRLLRQGGCGWDLAVLVPRVHAVMVSDFRQLGIG